MAKSLVEKAKEIQAVNTRANFYNEEELELVQAWLDDIVTLKQVMQVMKKSTASVYVFLAMGARELYRRAK